MLPPIIQGEIRAFVSLARRQSRLSVQYDRWAREAEDKSLHATAQRWRAVSDRLRKDADFAIHKAQDRKDRHAGA